MFIQATQAATVNDDAFCNLHSDEAKAGLLTARSILSWATTDDTPIVEAQNLVSKLNELLKKKPLPRGKNFGSTFSNSSSLRSMETFGHLLPKQNHHHL